MLLYAVMLLVIEIIFKFTDKKNLLLLAPHMSLMPSVICDCVGLARYTTAFGVLFMFRGVTSIVGPPAAGLSHFLLIDFIRFLFFLI